MTTPLHDTSTGNDKRVMNVTTPTILSRASLPSSCTGQASGTLWNNANALNVCP